MLSRCFLDFSVSVGAFVIGLSQMSSIFSDCFFLLFPRKTCQNHTSFCILNLHLFVNLLVI